MNKKTKAKKPSPKKRNQGELILQMMVGSAAFVAITKISDELHTMNERNARLEKAIVIMLQNLKGPDLDRATLSMIVDVLEAK